MNNIGVNYLLFCDAANTDSLGKTSILGVFDKILLNTVPSKYPKFTIALNISFKNLEQEKNKVEFKIYDPQKKELGIQPPIQLEVSIDEQNKNKGGNINLILDIANLEFKAYGKHLLVLYFNGKEIYTKLLLIEEGRLKN